jgi:hypothetical protein
MQFFQIRRLAPTLEGCAENWVDHHNVAEFSHFCRKAMSNFILLCSLQLILMVVVWGHGGKLVEKDDIYFRKYKCNCSRLCTRVWFSFCVNQELRHLTCACHWSLHWGITIIKACILPSTTIVSDCWMYNVCLHNDGLTHQLLNHSIIFAAHGCSHIQSRLKWMHVKVTLRPYWENKIKCVINGLRCSPFAEFDDVLESIVKCCV